MGKVSEAVQKVTELLKQLSPDVREIMLDKMEIRLAHLLKSNLVFRKANPQEWKDLKHRCKETDVLGLALAV